MGDPEFVLDFEEIYVIDSKTKSITRAKVLVRKILEALLINWHLIVILLVELYHAFCLPSFNFVLRNPYDLFDYIASYQHA